MNSKIFIGSEAQESIIVTDSLIQEMARLSNDYNPIHMSSEYSKKTIFEKRIAHGLIVEIIVSNLIGNKLPGRGAIFMNLEFKFIKPLFIGDVLYANGIIEDIIENDILLIRVDCLNQENILVSTCIAKVKYLEMNK
jgi:acyl dehydratase